MEEQQPQPLPPAPASVIPYATPAFLVATSEVWREGKTVIAPKDTTLPSRCVKCNAPVTSPAVKRTYYWQHPAWFLLLLLNLLIFVIVALAIRKKGTLYIHICDEHQKRRRNRIWLAVVLSFGGIALFIAGAAYNSGWYLLGGLVAFIVGIVCAFMSRLVSPRRIDDRFIWLAGCGTEFVQSLPALPNPGAPLPAAYPEQAGG
ncbi:MAG TPA: hypothetical protein VN541_05360 [Tepidisphaeraceae bacterium]|nr:hypothetical protein [Tepidisphaeraceae bacterium]